MELTRRRLKTDRAPLPFNPEIDAKAKAWCRAIQIAEYQSHGFETYGPPDQSHSKTVGGFRGLWLAFRRPVLAKLSCLVNCDRLTKPLLCANAKNTDLAISISSA